MKRTKWLAAVAALGVVAGGGQFASAASVSDVIADEFADATTNPGYESGDIVPMFFVDDDFAEFADDQGNPIGGPVEGGVLRGVADLVKIAYGTPLNSPGNPNASNANQTSGTTLGQGDSELTVFFELAVTNVIDGSFDLGPIAGRNGVIYTAFDDPDNDFNAEFATYEQAKATVEDGTMIAEIGFTGEGTEFFTFTPPAPGVDGIFELSLNYISEDVTPGNLSIVENEFGTTFYGKGTLATATDSGFFYDFTSQGDFVTLYVPTPAAVLPGIAMFGLLAFARPMRRNRRTEETV